MIIFFILLLISTICDCQSKLCQITSNGLFFDLSPLRNTTSDYFLPRNGTHQFWDFYLNLCQPVLTDYCSSGTGGCYVWGSKDNPGTASLGSFSSMILYTTGFVTAKTIVAQFSGGTASRSFEIQFYCNSTVDIGSPEFWDENPPLHFNFQWMTKYACPQKLDPCSTNSNCKSCTNSNCFWCADSSTCSTNKPLNCSNVFRNAKFCPSSNCTKFSSCGDCTYDQPDCAYCLDTMKCIPMSNTTNCSDYIQNPQYCPKK